MKPRRPWIAPLLLLALGAAGCAPKVVPAATPGAPRFPAFMFPAPPEALAAGPVAGRHQIGWEWLQAGDLRAAERSFTAVLKEAAGFYPAHAGLGYVATARKDYKEAIQHFDRAVAAAPEYVPALVGRGEAQLAVGDTAGALASFEAAAAADPQLPGLRSRIEVLRFRGLQNEVAAARKAAEAGRLTEARTAYLQAIASSPQSPFLYRELAAVELREGNLDAAFEHAEKAAQLDPGDARALVLVAEILERRGEYVKAADTLTAAVALEPSDALDVKIEELRERAAFEAMPEEYRTIEAAPSITRAQLAALLGVRLDDLLRKARRRNSVVMTDTRGNWAAPWILAVTRAGVMEAYPNHTFQPSATVRRADLALVASRALALIAADDPKLAAEWRSVRRKFPDLGPGHLSHAPASLAVEAGVMATLPDGSFALAQPVTGSEAVAAVKKLEDLAKKRGR